MWGDISDVQSDGDINLKKKNEQIYWSVNQRQLNGFFRKKSID